MVKEPEEEDTKPERHFKTCTETDSELTEITSREKYPNVQKTMRGKSKGFGGKSYETEGIKKMREVKKIE